MEEANLRVPNDIIEKAGIASTSREKELLLEMALALHQHRSLTEEDAKKWIQTTEDEQLYSMFVERLGKSPSKSIVDFYNEVNPLQFENPEKACERFDNLIMDLEKYTGAPNYFFNLQTIAARVKHRRAEIAIIERGLRLWPHNVDLLCSAFQCYYSTHYDFPKAAEIWNVLTGLPPEQTNPYWRFWDYGAIYLATQLHKPKEALELLDKGLRLVKRDGMLDLLRSYRRILVDAIPVSNLSDKPNDEIEQDYIRAQQILEEKYLLGMELGIESGYVLANDLANLYMEKAFQKMPPQSDKKGFKGETYLEKASQSIEYAEQLYTGAGKANHPVYEIYITRVRVLMAQKKYGDALHYLNSIPRVAMSQDPSLVVMKRLALERTGQKESESSIEPSALLQVLTRDGGQMLLDLSRQVPALQAIVINVAKALISSSSKE